MTPAAPPLPGILFSADAPEPEDAPPTEPLGIIPPTTPQTSSSPHFTDTQLSDLTAPVVWLTARDSFSVVAHWDRAPESDPAGNPNPVDSNRGGRWWMRLHADSADGPVITERPAPEASGTTLMPVLEPGRSYVAELGFESRRTGWHGVAISHQVQAPPEHRPPPPATPIHRDIQWASLAEPEAPPIPAPSPTPASPATEDPVDWAWTWFLTGDPGTSDSLAHPTQPASPTQPAPVAPAPRTDLPSSDVHPSTPAQGGRGFWMRINAEVILHGSTDPKAAVTVAGIPVSLRHDGSFSFRFAFPDGDFSLPVVATAPDGLESRQAIVRFQRDTQLIGEVSVHPVPPSSDPTL